MSEADRILVHGTVLAVLAEREGARACLAGAAVAAQAIRSAGIAALHVRIDPMKDILPTEEILLPAQQREMELEAAHEGEDLHRAFLSWKKGADDRLRSAWIDLEDHEGDDVRELGSQALLNVMAAVTRDSRGHARAALHTCLFKTHRPLLIVPHAYEPKGLRRIMVGWKDTPPGRKALEAAVPWFREAEAVKLLCIGSPDALELEWAKEHLASTGIAAETATIGAPEDSSVAEALLHETAKFEADWLVTGAYWHNEITEWIFGGVTEALIRKATLPVFMVH